jgi:glycerate dehydrogenase
MKIVVLDALTLGNDIDISCFEKYGNVTLYDKTYPEDTQARVKDADIIITNKVVINKEIMEATPSIKLICIAATGMNNVDLDEAKNRGIVVNNVAGYSTESVVQHTFSILFYILESLSYYDEFVKSGEWTNSRLFTNIQKPFSELDGKKWGIIGLGAIGKRVADVASAFGCDVSYYSTSGKNSNDSYNRVELDKLLKESDIVSIHAPLNDDTKDLLDQEELSLLKDKAILLNLGRGGIVNESAISSEIDKREVYFGTDVTSVEPLPSDNPLSSVVQKDRMFITPHIAWASKEARVRLVDGICKNIENFLSVNK